MILNNEVEIAIERIWYQVRNVLPDKRNMTEIRMHTSTLWDWLVQEGVITIKSSNEWRKISMDPEVFAAKAEEHLTSMAKPSH
jgi:hypothetical protein